MQEPEPGEIKAVLAYLGSGSWGDEDCAPTVGLSEIDDALGFTASNALLYLRDRGVVETSSTESETYVSLENNFDTARSYAETVATEYGGDYAHFAVVSDAIMFMDYPEEFEVPDPSDFDVDARERI